MKGTLRDARIELEAVLSKHGIETFVVMWRDPDSEDAEWITKGCRYWRIGTLQALAAEELRSATEPG